MSYSNLKLEFEGPVAVLTLSRPKALNALNSETFHQLDRALAEIEARLETRALIVTGEGEKAFVAGADIAEMAPLQPDEAEAFSSLGQWIFDRLERLHCPSIAAVNGFALGGGLELALACDLIYASERAKMGLPEVSLGVIPGFGGTQRLCRRVGQARAKELIFTGDVIDAARAKEIGLALEVLAPEALLPHCRAVAERWVKRGPLAVEAAKRVVCRGAEMELSGGLALERETFGRLFATQDRREGMDAFLAKRPPVFRRT